MFRDGNGYSFLYPGTCAQNWWVPGYPPVLKRKRVPVFKRGTRSIEKSVFFNQNYAGSGKCLSPALFLKSMILELTKINVVLIINFERKIASLCAKCSTN